MFVFKGFISVSFSFAASKPDFKKPNKPFLFFNSIISSISQLKISAIFSAKIFVVPVCEK
jgi:hypothetical protein